MRPPRVSPLHQFLQVLVATSDPKISTGIGDYLQGRGHAVDHVVDGHAAERLASQTTYDAMLLDVALPGIDGLTLCRRLREWQCTPAIVLLAADRTETTMLSGFDAGADDYLQKPASPPEVHARLQALARRGRTAAALTIGDLRFNPSTFHASRGDRRIDLRPSAFRLLHRLLLASPGVITREAAIRTIWGDSPPDGDSALRAHIHTLRSALEAPGEARLLHTLPGIGYRIALGDE